MIFKKWPFITVLAATITIFAAGVSTEPSKPTIIIIQGCSSSGKSSTAQELQNLYANDNKPFVYLPMDNFLSFLPKNGLISILMIANLMKLLMMVYGLLVCKMKIVFNL